MKKLIGLVLAIALVSLMGCNPVVGPDTTIEPVTYTVTFDTNGGNAIDKQTVISGEKVTRPANPAKDGYTFSNWTNADATYDFTLPVTSDIALKAAWTKNIPDPPPVIYLTVTFNSNGGNAITSQSIASGSKVSKPTDPTRDSYTFNGWTLNGVSYNFDSQVTTDITLVASWTENVPVQVTYFTITYDSNGGSTVAAQSIASGSKATKPSDPTYSPHNFLGWYNGSVSFDFNSAITDNITLTAKWTSTVEDKVQFTSTNLNIANKQYTGCVILDYTSGKFESSYMEGTTKNTKTGTFTITGNAIELIFVAGTQSYTYGYTIEGDTWTLNPINNVYAFNGFGNKVYTSTTVTKEILTSHEE